MLSDLIDILVIFVAFLIPAIGIERGWRRAKQPRAERRWWHLPFYYAAVVGAIVFVKASEHYCPVFLAQPRPARCGRRRGACGGLVDAGPGGPLRAASTAGTPCLRS
ncbi:MAG: hypothetical protein NTW19_17240, partial [Planctomycetota bacterium]|nr:hypothetical protein [Planctomycetota bacterium]